MSGENGDPVRRYDLLRGERPELFRNEPGGIEILTDPASVEAAGGVVYEDPYVLLVRDAVRFPDGRAGTYIRWMSPTAAPACAILPLLGDRMVLIEHYRHATRSWHWEIPRGFGTTGHTGEANAAKELAEEIGARVQELLPLGSLHPDSGLTCDRVLLFAARIDSVGGLEAAEGIRGALTLPFAEAEAMIADGRITDGFTIAAMTRARLAGLTT
ncbi:NUDIX hydrolase [Streptomyces gardneri]|uniref:ADP-ribose pyrophosphatase n=1 Tax=Streptomyces gardneri TaxID=66892 RepID=A0A4Y3RKU5_9ACTN|nr:NUDIX hydrolase [Streptomyces gardneri]GEB58356.1 ADP-ribose pyrophosphatase [Streptomyces gardneri]GHH03537.1 ADP-ribose pyrophosphatase [Streptomyces gardneri]